MHPGPFMKIHHSFFGGGMSLLSDWWILKMKLLIYSTVPVTANHSTWRNIPEDFNFRLTSPKQILFAEKIILSFKIL